MKYKIGSIIASGAVLGSLLVAAPAFAQTGDSDAHAWGGFMRGQMPGVFGTVSAVSGSMLSVASRGFGKDAATTTYSVDASSATVFKNGATSTVGSIAVNDKVMVSGSVSGTSVTAKVIRDGIMGFGNRPQPMKHATTTPALQGNGQPVVGGSVTAVSGSTITITNKSNVTYTVDASSATVTKKGSSSATVASVAVGDNVLVQGAVNGSAVTASSVIDQGAAPANTNPAQHPGMRGFLGLIGGFFQHVFGFF